MKKLILLSLLIFPILTGCGFTLRGTDSLALNPAMRQIQLNYPNSSNELALLLQRRLTAYSVELIDDSESYQLTLGAEQNRERVVSVNRNIRAGEYEMTLAASFQLNYQGETVINSEIISLTRIYEADPANAAAKTNEAELIKNELRQALVEQILRRLETVK